jgi:hypothetical protein
MPRLTEQHGVKSQKSSAPPTATTSNSAPIAVTRMTMHSAVQEQTNELESFLEWEPAGPLPNAACLGPLGAHLLDCQRACLQWNMLMCLLLGIGCK